MLGAKPLLGLALVSCFVRTEDGWPIPESGPVSTSIAMYKDSHIPQLLSTQLPLSHPARSLSPASSLPSCQRFSAFSLNTESDSNYTQHNKLQSSRIRQDVQPRPRARVPAGLQR